MRHAWQLWRKHEHAWLLLRMHLLTRSSSQGLCMSIILAS